MTKYQRTVDGFVPSRIFERLARSTSEVGVYASNSLALTRALWQSSEARQSQLFRFMQAAGLAKRFVYDAKEEESLPGQKARFEGDKATGDAAVDGSYDIFGANLEYYNQVHGRNSYDANGASLNGVVHYGRKYNNAFWNSQQMVAGDGDGVLFNSFVSLNIWAHELGHAVTEYAVPGGINYYGMAGAINEHFSDVAGANVESWAWNGKKGINANDYHWLVGKGLWVAAPAGSKAVREALRNMLRPGTAYNDPDAGIKDSQPDHMTKYVKTWSDNGGVHINSGIPNRAYAEFARLIQSAFGGTSWADTIGVADQVWYAARPNLTSNPSFGQLAYWTREACATQKQGDKLRAVCEQAWDVVGVKPDKKAVDDQTPVAPEDAAA